MSYAGPLIQPKPTVRPGRAWIVLGWLLMIASFLTFVVLGALTLARFGNDISDLTSISPDQQETMELDAHEYFVYASGVARPEVSIVGDAGEVPLLRSQDTTMRSTDDQYWAAERYFRVETAGSYVVSNTGTEDIAVGSADYGQLATGFNRAFLVGALLGVPGFIMVVAAAIARRRSRKRLRATTGTYSGVPYNQGPLGGQPPGPFGTPPGSYGNPPPSYGALPPGPYANPQPGPSGPGQSPPTSLPPSSWPGR